MLEEFLACHNKPQDNESAGGFPETSTFTPLVSVIIPSKNSANTIARCIESVLGQSYRRIEVIVVDGFSTDSTRDVAASFGVIVVTAVGERSSAKNVGAKFAKGTYLYFLDADQQLGPRVIEACVNSVQEADGVLIRDQDRVSPSLVSRLIASRRRILSNDPLDVATRFIKRIVFDNLGGFDLDLYVGEDLDFHRRFLLGGFKIVYCEAAVWHLGSPANLKDLWNRSFYYSNNYLLYIERNPFISLKRLNPFREAQAWKKSNTRGPDLLPIVFLGLLSDFFLATGILLNVGRQRLQR